LLDIGIFIYVGEAFAIDPYVGDAFIYVGDTLLDKLGFFNNRVLVSPIIPLPPIYAVSISLLGLVTEY
jgi:hypothetical protein